MHESAKPHLHYITNDAFLADVQSLAQAIDQSDWKPDFIIGI